jgi:UDP-N-acetylglucosamine 2-epimerase
VLGVILLSIVGTRPNVIKLASIDRSCKRLGIPHFIIDTNQHFHDEMSSAIYEELGINENLSRLSVAGLSTLEDFAKSLIDISPLLLQSEDSHVLVYGDTHSTFLGAYAAKRFGKVLGHVEAGLRSNNRQMPEELNRLMVDDISDRLYAPTLTAYNNLISEGKKSRSLFVGDVVTDLLSDKKRELDLTIPKRKKEGVLVTLHRPSNVDNPETLRSIFSELNEISRKGVKVTLMRHPRLMKSVLNSNIDLKSYSFLVSPAITFLKMLESLYSSELLITDSGGLQRDAHFMGTKCLTLRGETEWLETLEDGWNVLCPNPLNLSRMSEFLISQELDSGTPQPNVRSIGDLLLEDFMSHEL